MEVYRIITILISLLALLCLVLGLAEDSPLCTRSCAGVTFFFFFPAAPSAFSACCCFCFYSQPDQPHIPVKRPLGSHSKPTIDHIFNIVNHTTAPPADKEKTAYRGLDILERRRESSIRRREVTEWLSRRRLGVLVGKKESVRVSGGVLASGQTKGVISSLE